MPKKSNKKDPRLVKNNLSGYNKMKRTPGHPKKAYVVLARENGKTRLIRFGQQGAKREGSDPKTSKGKTRRKSFRARHKCKEQKSKLTAQYWACKLW